MTYQAQLPLPRLAAYGNLSSYIVNFVRVLDGQTGEVFQNNALCVPIVRSERPNQPEIMSQSTEQAAFRESSLRPRA